MTGPTRRVSTANTKIQSFPSLMLSQLPVGRILNLGAGSSRPVAPDRDVVNVDHAVGILATSSRSVIADATHLPFADQSMDGAILKDVLEHLQDPVGALTEVHRVTRPGARIVITVPRAIPRAVWADPTHIRGFTAKAIVDALALAGWQPTGPPRRMGSIPFAGRIPWLLAHAEQLLRFPVIGHRLGTNWLVRADKVDIDHGSDR